MKSVLSIDWLSYFGEFSPSCVLSPLKLRMCDYGTKVFRSRADVLCGERVVGTIAFAPRSSILDDKLAVFKFENSVLYEADFCDLRKQIIHCLRLNIKGINRLDLALDFNYLQNGMNGHVFIKQFLSAKYLHNGRGKFSVQGSQKFENDFEYLRLGSKTSPVVAYLYNKSKELQDVKLKPYIVERWKQAGLNTDVSVWRLEFSMGSDFFSMVDKDSGAFPLTKDCKFDDIDELKILYQSLINRYFEFRLNNGTQNKSRMPKVDLVVLSDVFGSYSRITANRQSGRRERMFLHYLHKYSERIGFNSLNAGFELEYVKSEFIKKTGLESYYLKKRDAWDLAE